MLGLIALLSLGPGYDTSTTLLNLDAISQNISAGTSWPQLAIKSYVQKFIRWDAIYFTQIAQRGYLWEQEWAFGWGYTKFISAMTKGTNN